MSATLSSLGLALSATRLCFCLALVTWLLISTMGGSFRVAHAQFSGGQTANLWKTICVLFGALICTASVNVAECLARACMGLIGGVADEVLLGGGGMHNEGDGAYASLARFRKLASGQLTALDPLAVMFISDSFCPASLTWSVTRLGICILVCTDSYLISSQAGSVRRGPDK